MTFTIHETPEYQTAASKAGADGYLSKNSSRDELIQSMEAILDGKPKSPSNDRE